MKEEQWASGLYNVVPFYLIPTRILYLDSELLPPSMVHDLHPYPAPYILSFYFSIPDTIPDSQRHVVVPLS